MPTRMGPVVETLAGVVRGRAEGRLCVFRGIPFAAPVGGAARFRAPGPPRAWSGVRDAGRFGPVPAQRSDPMVEWLGLLGDHVVGDDCLTLNLWTPGLDAGRRPVLVWLHGGAFVTGTGAAPIYDGRRLAERGDAVVVTLNYRVGAPGFLHVPELGASNRGLLDQIAALRWVAEHAERFGGDPERVTVFGESAGAGSLACLMTAPAARGLFRRAIVQSAAPTGVAGRREAEARSARFLAGLGAGPPLPERPVEAILDAQERLAAAGPYRFDMAFVPVVDGDVLPRAPLAAAADGATAGVDLLVGTTAEEMRLFALAVDEARFDQSALRDAVALEIALAGAGGDADEVIDAYRAIRTARGESATPARLLHAIQSDLRLRHPSIRLAEAHARHGGRTWMYLFTWPSPFEGGRLGACHAVDLPFTFGTLDAPGMDAFGGAGPAAQRVAEHWMDALLAFARDGSPEHPGTGPWPAYEAERRATLAVGERCELLNAPGDEERRLLDRLGASDAA